jgi:hypothetical protein
MQFWIDKFKWIWARGFDVKKTLEMSCEIETLYRGWGRVPGLFLVV